MLKSLDKKSSLNFVLISVWICACFGSSLSLRRWCCMCICVSSKCQFHQYFMPALFEWKCFAQLFSNFSLALLFFGERILAQKLRVKCWWNWLQVQNEIRKKVWRFFDAAALQLLQHCTHIHTLRHTHSHTHTQTLTHTHALTHTHSDTHTHTFDPFIFVWIEKTGGKKRQRRN